MNLSLKDVIDRTPNCFICQKPFNLYWNFYISYSDGAEGFVGLGSHFTKLKLKDGKLSDGKHWQFDLETGKAEKSLKLFNKTLGVFSKPFLQKKCKTCDVRQQFEPQYNHILNYESMPPLLLVRESASFCLTPKLRLELIQQTKAPDFFESQNAVHIYREHPYAAVYRENITTEYDFSDSKLFKRLKNKFKTLITFI